MNTFSVGETMRFAWGLFKQRPWFFVGITVLVLIVSSIGSSISDMFGHEDALSVIGGAISILFSTMIGLGSAALYLRAHESVESVESSALWHPQGFWSFLAVSILATVAVILGLILLVVPGVIAGIMFMFATYIVVDRKLAPLEAMRESRRITKGHLWDLFLFLLAIIGINILGLLALVVGLLVTIPVTSIAIVHAYRALEHAASEVAPAAAVTA